MKAQVLSLTGQVDHEIDLPAVFDEPYRPDLIKRAVLAIQSRRRQPHGSYVYAGITASAVSWGSGRGVAQIPRLKNSSRAAKVPQTRGGRPAHPPKVAKILVKYINKKEKRKALISAIAATINEKLVRSRGHQFEGTLPFVLDNQFEDLEKTKDVIEVLKAVGVYADVLRAEDSRKVRAGRGKMRGRRYKQRKSLLIVTGDAPLKAARNISGVDVASASSLNVEMLAPGTQSARLTIYTENAITMLGGVR